MNLYKITPGEVESMEETMTAWKLKPFFVVAGDMTEAHLLGMMHGIKEMNRANEKIDKENERRKAKSMHPLIMMMSEQMSPVTADGSMPHISGIKIEAIKLVQEDIMVEGRS